MPTSERYNIAHRGARSLAPENTMPAFLKAWELGAHGIETDVRVTSDDKLIICHDNTLGRTTNIKNIFPNRHNQGLHNLKLQEIQKLDAGSWFLEKDPFKSIENGYLDSEEIESFKNIRIPLLEELLTFIKEKKWFINIEIKQLPKEIANYPIVEKLLALVEDLHMETALFSFSSFDHTLIRKVRELRPDVEINALIGENPLKPNNWGNYEFKIYNANVELIDALQIEKAHNRGCRINLYTVNNLAEMKHYLSLGVEKIITDFPQFLI